MVHIMTKGGYNSSPHAVTVATFAVFKRNKVLYVAQNGRMMHATTQHQVMVNTETATTRYMLFYEAPIGKIIISGHSAPYNLNNLRFISHGG